MLWEDDETRITSLSLHVGALKYAGRLGRDDLGAKTISLFTMGDLSTYFYPFKDLAILIMLTFVLRNCNILWFR